MTQSAPLIATKLGIPARDRQYVARRRLLDRLDATGGTRLVLLSAPAGFGKTALLADWLTNGRRRFAWLSLDAADNDPARFLRYLHEAASVLRSPDAPPATPSLHGAPDAESVTAELVSASSGQIGGAVVVLDDYQVLATERVHSIVAGIIERVPPTACLAIATRADPPLPLARLRARGELLEIRADDLRFTLDESTAFLAGPMSLELAPDLVDTLARRTEGWVAALQLAALSLRDRDDPARLVHEFGASNRFLLDFVLEEVLANQPPDATDFLLRTSVLDRLTASLCDALTGRADGAEVLDRLDRSNALLFPLDRDRRWFRYHQLFAELLQARLAMRDPDLASALHGRAAGWFEAHDLPVEGIEHALLAGDAVTARRLVRKHWTTVMHAGQLWTVQRWLDALPAEVVRNDPQLSATYAWGLILRGETDGVAARLGDARVALAAREEIEPADKALVPPQVEMIEAKRAELLRDPQREIAHALAAIGLIPEGIPEDAAALLRGDALNLLGQGHLLAGDDRAAEIAFSEALPLLHRAGNAIAVAHGTCHLARIAIRRGEPHRALALCNSAMPATGEAEPAAAAAIHLARAEALVVLGQTDAARTAALRAEQLARDSGDASVLRDARATLERVPADQAGHARSKGVPGGLIERLTPREAEVLVLLAAGRSNRQIAAELFVTLGTVKAHVHGICGKLGVTSRVQAIVRGRELGLLA